MTATTRREVVGTMATTLAMLVVGGIAHWLSRGRWVQYPAVKRPYAKAAGILRPPGSLPEAEFFAACIRCYRCQDACEPGAIQFYTERDGAYFHTPYVDPAKAGCTLCNKCGPACPTGAILPFGDMTAVDMGKVELSEDLCLSFKARDLRSRQELLTQLGRHPTEVEAEAERRGPCGECYTFCPLRGRAITLEPGQFLAPIVHLEACVGCGMCEEICRTMVRGEPAIRVVRTRRPVYPLESAA
ncbi:MAG: 4Fe-4S dicluster domain-containing protein [Planctomycetota bacterium]